jgi:SNF2 family DNA or RNA helicase
VIFTPEPYQSSIRDFLLAQKRAYLVAGMGLGKTASTLAALYKLFRDGEIRSALIVAPVRVARLTWPNEVRKWEGFRWMKAEILTGQAPSGKAQLYLVNYERLHQLQHLKFCDVVVFDEITRAKNPKSKRIKAFSPLLKHHRRWGLTGTPRPNSLMELFGQVRLLDGGERLGRSFSQFRNAWFTPTDYMEYNWVPKPGAEDAIYKRIADLTLTLRASDYLDVPDTIVEDIEIALPESATEMYETLEKELLVTIADSEIVAPSAATLVNKLLQVCGGSVYDEGRKPVFIHDAKLSALKKLLTSLGDARVIVFTNYVHERERVVEATGGTDAAKVKGDIETLWNSGKLASPLVADPRSLGHGLNLQSGHVVVWYSPTWSREQYDHARVARKGQTEQPLVYRIICRDTIDEAVVETLREKGDGQAQMLLLLHNLQSLRSEV